MPITYHGDATGAVNLAESVRLEWGDEPDDTLVFTAPEAGTYRIALADGPSDLCGPSVEQYGGTLFDPSSCPSGTEPVMLDGVYSGQRPVALTQGQQVLIWVSCATYGPGDVRSGPYTLVIEKL